MAQAVQREEQLVELPERQEAVTAAARAVPSPRSVWIYVVTDECGGWAIVANDLLPRRRLVDDSLTLEIVGTVESYAVAARAVAEINSRLAPSLLPWRPRQTEH